MVTTLLELVGLALIVIGFLLTLGNGPAAIVAGFALLLLSERTTKKGRKK